MSWHDAVDHAARLSPDGFRLESEPVHAWRLPTVEEAVRSLTFRGLNAGGVWDPRAERATYRVTPDKETPLWDPHSRVIYWWTSTEVDRSAALSVTYNGRTNRRPKSAAQDYLGFRAVRAASVTAPTGVR
ncbi:MAG: hypothetical protein AMXMBFR53_35510 [Gemmatimonadota bacterium]